MPVSWRLSGVHVVGEVAYREAPCRYLGEPSTSGAMRQSGHVAFTAAFGRAGLVQQKADRFLGDDLLFQPVTRQVPSALEGLTAGFGMRPGIPPPLRSPRNLSAF